MRETTELNLRLRISAISSNVCPSSRSRTVSSAGREPRAVESICARSPLRNRLSAERISSPYISVFFSPKPGTRRSSEKLDGLTQHKCSNVVSCMTTNAAIPFCLETFLRHSRIYSFKSRLGSDAFAFREAVSGCSPSPAGNAGFFRLRVCVTASIQSGTLAQTSHWPHSSHFGDSPKCWQKYRWRHSLEFTKLSIS